MDFPLRNLNETEKDSLKTAPIYVGLLIASVDGEVSENELARIEDIIKTKTFSEQNDVHYLYTELANNDLLGNINTIFNGLGDSTEARVSGATEALKNLNSILPKVSSYLCIAVSRFVTRHCSGSS